MTYREMFGSFVWTGSGESALNLDLGSATARIMLSERWSDDDDTPTRSELRCAHQPIDPHHGLLDVLSAAFAASPEAQLRPAAPLADWHIPITIEYVRIPSTTVHMPPAANWRDLRDAGQAGWNSHFEILLFVNELCWPTTPPWGYLRRAIDKAKLTMLSRGAEQRSTAYPVS